MTYYSREEFTELDPSAKAEYYDRLRISRKEAVTASQKEDLAEAFGELSGYNDSDELRDELKAEAEDQKRFDTGYRMNGKKKGLIITLIVAAVAVIVASVIVISSLSETKKDKYESALSLYNSGKLEEAREIFESLGGFRDSKLYIVIIDSKKNAHTFGGKEIRTGGVVTLGRYEQDSDTLTIDPIEWCVLDVIIDEDKGTKRAVLVSKDILAVRPYGGDDWKNSAIRAWLGGEFFESAFTVAEQDKIVGVLYSEYKDASGKELLYECSDVVTIPSLSDIEKYLNEATHASADVSASVAAQIDHTGNGEYWLCSYTGEGNSLYVSENGQRPAGGRPNDDVIGVRPMIVVRLDGSK